MLTPQEAREKRSKPLKDEFLQYELKIDNALTNGPITPSGEIFININNWPERIINHAIEQYSTVGWYVTRGADRDSAYLKFTILNV